MKKTDLSGTQHYNFPGIDRKKIGLVISSWNTEITGALREAAVSTLLKSGIEEGNIMEIEVPGSFELPLGARYLLENHKVDGVVCLGCIIQGETRHFEFIAQAVAKGIMDVNLNYGKPVGFGVLTTDNYEQAKERAGGKHGNKGIEAAISTLIMIHKRS